MAERFRAGIPVALRNPQPWALQSAPRLYHGGKASAPCREFSTLVRGLPPETVGPLTLIADSIDRTRGYAVDIAETAMNQTFQQQ